MNHARRKGTGMGLLGRGLLAATLIAGSFLFLQVISMLNPVQTSGLRYMLISAANIN